jgi:hypothetical protein
MTARVRVVLDRSALDRLAARQSRAAVDKASYRAALLAKANVAKATRIRTGAMRQSIRTLDVKVSGATVIAVVGSDVRYALWQEEGVRGPIRPRRARWLRFIPKWQYHYVYAKKVRGFPGAHYMRDAAQALTVRDFIP